MERYWKAFWTMEMCLACLVRKPEHIQRCGSVAPLAIKQVPPYAFQRALAVDGGGVGGTFSLEALGAPEQAMDHPWPLQDLTVRISATQPSQYLAQSDTITKVFGQSYVGKGFSVNRRATVLKEKADHSFID
ncbi:hypothetical protein LTR66_008656 [Elasticomyces elasticus]|nr:hypothetical protein LTR66_008656 [Elasticomyces elasticus]